VHEMIVCAVEKPMLEVVMARAEGNQSRAAEWLGINRNTLRRKLLEHGLVR
jgi:Fis family transcriptional regulator, factor for inversion stimulation protein